jgi:uncharacterized YccA/Bax inhibitor family protein
MPNPVWKNAKFNEKTDNLEKRSLSLNRVISKSILCFVLLILATSFMWSRYFASKGDILITLAALAAGFLTTWISVRLPEISTVTVPVHGIVEGLAVGGISAFIERLYPGLALNAVLLTFSAALVVIAAYRAEILVRANRLIKVVLTAIGGIGVFYIVTFVLKIFSIDAFGFISPIGMGICFLLTAIASWNLVRDFEFIEEAAQTRTRARMEWIAVLGLLVTMGWIYLEFFRLVNGAKAFIKNKFKKGRERIRPAGEKGKSNNTSTDMKK